jgi:chorismate lyase/3-hydroxybenzoate synthase
MTRRLLPGFAVPRLVGSIETMAHTQESEVRAGAWLQPLVARPPAWVPSLIGSAVYAVTALAHATLGELHLATIDGLTHASTMIPDAALLSASALEQAVAAAYHALVTALSHGGGHPVRFWNFIPGIHAAMGAERDRYMVFNAGRFNAFTDCYGSPAAFSRAVPTASAVGVREGPLVIHGLGLPEPGVPLENPRQIPAYDYSRRYGPRPPCFARATVVDMPVGSASAATHVSAVDALPHNGRERRLLVGGTASILGEDSIHVRDVRRQAYETFENLARLVASARGLGAAPVGIDDGAMDDHRVRELLAAFRELRVYVVRTEDADTLQALVADHFPAVAQVEFAQADLCRQELLVEIEGVAAL